MKLLILTLALLSTKALAVGFLAPTTTGTALIDVLTQNELRFHIGQVGQTSTIKGEVDIASEHVYLFGWLPVADGGLFTVNLTKPDGTTETWTRSGAFGQVDSVTPAPGHYEYEIISDSNVAEVYWQLISNGVPETGDFFLCGWTGLLGVMLGLKRDTKRS